MVDRSLRIRGRVQGVGFRWWASREARRLGLRGAVRNAPDGSVELRLAGPPDAVATMMEQLAHGPPAARVDAVEDVANGLPLPDGFEISH